MAKKNQVRTYERAFTIIEVVLVLAIAGLIFLMVFIALPALQRAQRNTERKRQVDVVYTGIVEYQKNNKNDPPCRNYGGNWGCDYDTNFIPRYVDDECEFDYSEMGIYYYEGCSAPFTDPDGTTYSALVYADVTRQSIRWSKTDEKKDTIAKEVKNKITNPLLTSISKTGSILDSAKYFGYGRQASADDIYDHAMVIAFGYKCSVTEGKALITFKPNDFIVALRLEGGGMYCHGSSTGAEDQTFGEYSIIPDWGGYYGVAAK